MMMNESVKSTQEAQARMVMSYIKSMHKFTDDDRKFIQDMMKDQSNQAQQAIDNLNRVLEI